MIASRYQDERKQPAYERFGIGTETLLNPAAVSARQKDTTAIGPMGELPLLGAATDGREPWLGTDLRIRG
jgi:hypothetical protein